ncbi:MAG: dipeptidyl-peptidase 3 family protein [Allosphingosinicella sp.]
MRHAALALLLATAACAASPSPPATPSASADAYDLAAQRAKIARIEMHPDTSFLNAEERDVVNDLIQAADLLNPVFLRQVSADNPAVREAIARSGRPDRALLLDWFDFNAGPWDTLADNRPFWGERALPPGGGVYPADLTKDALDAYLVAHLDEKAALTDPYTVVKRDGDRLVAVPYSVEYRQWLEPAAKLLEKAAARTSNASLKRFLTLRAQAFRTNDYYESEMAWMDVSGTPIEVVIGPYEVYVDNLYAQKTAFESYVTVADPRQSAALARYKALLPDMERNLPVDAKYKNANRPFSSPILVTEEVHGGGEAGPGIQTIAFNLPNDERVRAAKGAKKVILANVLGAKYERIVAPLAGLVFVPEQARSVTKDYMTQETLFHELSHSLGPGIITIGGRETTVNAELKDQYSAVEESKADVMGAWNILYLMHRGELPIADREQLLASYMADVFRHLRFGTADAHGRGAAMQYGFLREHGGLAWDASAARFRLDYDKLEAAIPLLVAELVRFEGDGDYAGAKAFLDRYVGLDPEARAVIATMTHIPVDIQPVYPARV